MRTDKQHGQGSGLYAAPGPSKGSSVALCSLMFACSWLKCPPLHRWDHICCPNEKRHHDCYELPEAVCSPFQGLSTAASSRLEGVHEVYQSKHGNRRSRLIACIRRGGRLLYGRTFGGAYINRSLVELRVYYRPHRLRASCQRGHNRYCTRRWWELEL